MNAVTRLAALWWAIWSVLRGVDSARLTPLPPPLVDPRRTAAQLIGEADAQGVADAKATMLDSWSFGAPHEPESDLFDPSYVRSLRHRAVAAVAALRESQQLTDTRIAHVRQMRDEQAARMRDARLRMSELAARDRALEAVRLDELDPPGVAPDPAAPEGDTPWEGETVPLGLGWRLLILLGLVVAELPVQWYVFDYLFGATDPGLGQWMAAVTSAVVVFAPFVAGTLVRNRQASTAERRTLHAIIVLSFGWLLVAALLGFVRGRLLEANTPRPDRLNLTPQTIMIMFVALLVVVGAMAFMLGLARRHPFQEAYLRHRDRRDRFDTLMRTMATRINPAYVDPQVTLEEAGDAERAIRESYAAAEDAYFAALTRTVGDPAFTEAVQQRRGTRVGTGA